MTSFSLARSLVQRFLYAVPVLFVVATAVFFLIHLVPGDPVQQMLGERAQPGDMEQLRRTLGLDRPVGEQYLNYLGRAVRGDWGTSFRFNAPVASLILARYPATLLLTLAALVVALLLAIPAGVHAAVHRGQ